MSNISIWRKDFIKPLYLDRMTYDESVFLLCSHTITTVVYWATTTSLWQTHILYVVVSDIIFLSYYCPFSSHPRDCLVLYIHLPIFMVKNGMCWLKFTQDSSNSFAKDSRCYWRSQILNEECILDILRKKWGFVTLVKQQGILKILNETYSKRGIYVVLL